MSPLKIKRSKIVSSPTVKSPSTSSSMDIATKTAILVKKFAEIPPATPAAAAKKPKKGMATAKQRLGKILKINKFARF